jgi:hypothetical protein
MINRGVPVEAIADLVTQNPFYGPGIALLALLPIAALARRMFKLAIIAVLPALGYGYYLHDRAEGAEASVDAFKQKAQEPTS